MLTENQQKLLSHPAMKEHPVLAGILRAAWELAAVRLKIIETQERNMSLLREKCLLLEEQIEILKGV